MEHEMKLNSDSFERMKSGFKRTEVRLNDDKRKKVKVGDIIIFSKRPELKERLKARVIGRKEVKTHLGMDRYYSKEEQDKYGFVIFELVFL